MFRLFKFWNWKKKEPNEKFNIELIDSTIKNEPAVSEEICKISNTQMVLDCIIELEKEGFYIFTSRMVWRHMNGELQPSAISKCLYRLKQRGKVKKITRLNSKEDESLSYWSLIKPD